MIFGIYYVTAATVTVGGGSVPLPSTDPAVISTALVSGEHLVATAGVVTVGAQVTLIGSLDLSTATEVKASRVAAVSATLNSLATARLL